MISAIIEPYLSHIPILLLALELSGRWLRTLKGNLLKIEGASRMADRVGQQLGNYRLIRLLGKGGFAEVYLGEHIFLKSPSAIKVLYMRLADEGLESFLAEAQIIARLLHPHIVRVFDFGVNAEDNTPFLAMDYAANGNLRKTYPRGVPLPLPTVVAYTRQVAS